jgi:hypothetical protein
MYEPTGGNAMQNANFSNCVYQICNREFAGNVFVIKQPKNLVQPTGFVACWTKYATDLSDQKPTFGFVPLLQHFLQHYVNSVVDVVFAKQDKQCMYYW